MAIKDIDWGNLGFDYIPCDYSYVSNFKDGAWDEGCLTESHTLTLSEDAGIFHYCQEIFEGLKAYRTEDNSIVCFRPDQNAKRMHDSAERLIMPPFPEEKFVEAVKEVVAANSDWVAPYGSGASLYIRPFMIATGNVIGVAPSSEYQFRIFVSPVGPYFKGSTTAVALKVSDYDRAAAHGTGHIKAGLNYAMSLYPSVDAHNAGYAENVYLDPSSRTYIEETGGSNILFVDKQGTLVVPESLHNSILPSITRRSLVEIAQTCLGIKVESRLVSLKEVEEGAFTECGLCGTAAVISPVGRIDSKNGSTTFTTIETAEETVMSKLYQTLVDIQTQKIEDPFNWVCKIK